MGGGPRPRLAVIDLGGTMVADGWLVNAAIHTSLAEAGIPVTAELMAQLRGRDRRTALARASQPGWTPRRRHRRCRGSDDGS